MADHRETIVVREDGSGSGMILGILAVLIVLAVGWYFLIGPGAGSTRAPNDMNVKIELPSAAPAAS